METGLERFVKAQETAYPAALAEIKRGKKQGHWMWYIFPQLSGLGHSETARYYAIRDRQEAEAYMHHPLLGVRLVQISTELLFLDETDPLRIFGYTDSLKLCSCMTLFYEVSHNFIFKRVLDKFFGGEADSLTLNMLK